MKEKEFPKTIVMPEEADANRHNIRVLIQRVQSAYLDLKNNPEFSMPASLEKLTVEYVHEFFRPTMERIENDPLLEPEQRAKLRMRRGRIQAAVTTKVNIICTGMKSTPQLKWVFDEAIQMPVPTAPIDEVADKMARCEVPHLASDHWLLVQVIASAIKELRAWEKKNRIVKQPLNTLTAWDEQEFARRWAQGMTTNPEEEERTRAIREARERLIF